MYYAEPFEEVDALSLTLFFSQAAPEGSRPLTLLIKTPIFSNLFAAYYLIARLTSSVSSVSPTILSLEVPQLELINILYTYINRHAEPPNITKQKTL